MSLRSLVDWIHEHMLQARYTEHGRSTLEPRLTSDYEILRNPDDESHQTVLSDLDGDGINGEDFVSPATLHRHLTGYIDIEKNSTEARESSDRDELEYVEDRAETYVSNLLSAWDTEGTVPQAADASVEVRIYLECPHCAKQTSIRQVRQRGYVCETHRSKEVESEPN